MKNYIKQISNGEYQFATHESGGGGDCLFHSIAAGIEIANSIRIFFDCICPVKILLTSLKFSFEYIALLKSFLLEIEGMIAKIGKLALSIISVDLIVSSKYSITIFIPKSLITKYISSS